MIVLPILVITDTCARSIFVLNAVAQWNFGAISRGRRVVLGIASHVLFVHLLVDCITLVRTVLMIA
jgi:hypothetical protein